MRRSIQYCSAIGETTWAYSRCKWDTVGCEGCDTHVVHVVLKEPMQCPNPSKSQGRCHVGPATSFGEILRSTATQLYISTHVVFVASQCNITRKELNVINASYGITHAALEWVTPYTNTWDAKRICGFASIVVYHNSQVHTSMQRRIMCHSHYLGLIWSASCIECSQVAGLI